MRIFLNRVRKCGLIEIQGVGIEEMERWRKFESLRITFLA